jgi:hypothetical protein
MPSRVARDFDDLEVQTQQAHRAAISQPRNRLWHVLALRPKYLCTRCFPKDIHAFRVIGMVVRD